MSKNSQPATLDFRRTAAFIALYFCLGVFINGFTSLPLTFLLKERLRLGPMQLSWFAAISDWAWYVKPMFGLISDRVPIGGRRRRPYLALMGVLLVAAWGSLAAAPAYGYGLLLASLALNALALAFLNTVTAGLLAELSRATRASGRLNSLRQVASQVALLAAGPAGGWAAAHWPFQRVALVAAAVALLLLTGALLLVDEPKLQPQERGAAARSHSGSPALVAALRSRAVWLALGFIMLVELSPGFNTPLLFYQRDVLHFRKELFGQIQMAGALAAIIAAAGYARLCRRRSLAVLLPGVILLHAVATLGWLLLRTPATALALKGLTGFTLSLASLAIFDLATRAAPPGAEGIVLAAIFAGVNIAGKLSDLIGSSLYERHWSLPALVLLNAGTTLVAALLAPLLPSSLVERRDGEEPRSEVAAVDLDLSGEVLDVDDGARVGAGAGGVEVEGGHLVLRESLGEERA